MATFVTLPDTDLDANSPITESLMLALRDNPIAIAQGDASAPNIANNAFADNSINGGKILNSSIAQSKIGYSYPGTSGSISANNSVVVLTQVGLLMVAYIPDDYLFSWMEIYVNGAWRKATANGIVYSTGSNIRITSLGSSYTVILHYSKIN